MPFDVSSYDLHSSNCSSSSSISSNTRSNSSSTVSSIPIAINAIKGPKLNNHPIIKGNHTTLRNMSLPDSFDAYSKHLNNGHRYIQPQDSHSTRSPICNPSPTHYTEVNDESIFQLDLDQPGCSKRTNDVYNTLGYKLVHQESRGQPYCPGSQAEKPRNQQTRQKIPRFHPLQYVCEDITQSAHSGPILSPSPVLMTPPTPLLGCKLAEPSVENLSLLNDQVDLPLASLAVRHSETCFDGTHQPYPRPDTVSLFRLQGQMSWVAEELRGVTLMERKCGEGIEPI